jgi:DNA-binding MarR family transcriptional regulator
MSSFKHSDEKKVLANLLKALKPFKRLRDTMPLQYMRTFILIAREEGLNVSTYAKRADISQSLMTRHLADLGKTNRYHKPGFGLVEQYEDFQDRRNSLIRLTVKGQHVVSEMCEAFK